MLLALIALMLAARLPSFAQTAALQARLPRAEARLAGFEAQIADRDVQQRLVGATATLDDSR